MTIIETLAAKYPVRKSAEQKAAFRQWVVEQSEKMGYQAVPDAKGYSRNVVVGDPETAEVVFTAHYDTPPVMPVPNFITPTNVFIYILYQIAITLGLLIPCGAVGLAVGLLTGSFWPGYFAGFFILFILTALMMFGPANRHNVNDNTSGIAAVLEIMARLPQEQRSKAAFILFDNEEKGLLGSSAFAGRHPKVKKEKLLINMDCVGDGETILFFANKKTRALPCFPALNDAMSNQTGCEFRMNEMEKCFYPSDQAHFTYGVAVCACLKGRFGYYCNKIHTAKDTVCRQENLDFLANGLSEFVKQL